MINIRHIITAAVAMLCSLQLLAMNDNRQPDFAFPAQVAKNAGIKLDKALRSSDFKEVIHQYINLQLARTAIDPDSIQEAIVMADSLTPRITDRFCRSIMLMLTARVYTDFFTANRWKYDARDLPLNPLPENISSWSGRQFRYEIDRLINEAMADPKSLSKEPAGAYSGIIKSDSKQKLYYPTLLDFMSWQAADIYNRIGSRDKAHDMLGYITRWSAPGSAPYVMAMTRMIESERQNDTSYDEWQTEVYRRLRELYDHTDGQQRCIPLEAIAKGGNNSTDRQWIYGQLKKVIAEYPAFYNINSLKNSLHLIETKSVAITTREVCAPGEDLTIKVQSSNASVARILLYRLPDMLVFDRYFRLKPDSKVNRIDSRTVKFDGTVPFSSDTTVTFQINSPGYYIVVPEINGVSPYKQSYEIIHCTSMATGLLSFDRQTAIVVNPVNGQPTENATVAVYRHRYNERPSAPLLTAATGSDGMATIDALSHDGSYRIVTKKGNDTYTIPLNLYIPQHRTADERIFVQGFTDLALYRPGDKINWMGVVYKTTPGRKQTIADREISVRMINASGQPVDTLTSTTDRFGRVSGDFTIPKGELTGYYRLLFETAEKQTIGNVGFEVSDYKLPTFKIEITAIVKDSPVKGAVTVNGTASTYSGMPLAGAAVKTSVSKIGWAWWRRANGNSFYTSPDTLTDGVGSFSVVIPAEALSPAELSHELLSATVTVTSSTSESQTASRMFTLGMPYHISATVPSDINIDRPANLNIRITGPDGKEITDTLQWEIMRDSAVVASGQSASDRPLDLDGLGLTSGIYSLRLSLLEKDCSPLTVSDIALYRMSDPLPPRDEPLWVPQLSYSGGEPVVFGTPAGRSFVLMTVWTTDSIMSRRWLTLDGGIHTLPSEIPQSIERATISLMSTRNYRSTVKDITVTNPAAPKGLRIVLDTFRDRVTPGSEEKWTIRVVPADTALSPEQKAVIVDMYNAALDKLAPHSLTMHLEETGGKSLSTTPPNTGDNFSSTAETIFKWLPTRNVDAPGFNTYGRSFFESAGNGILYETVTTAGGVGMTRSVMMKSMKTAAKAEAVTEDCMLADDETANDTGAPESGEQKTNDADGQYRPSEIALAMFRPMLTTDENGLLALTFTVPDANTTWRFIATGFDTSLRHTTEIRDITASKRIMVTPNPPRFLRNGDEADIEVAVFNNSDHAVTARVINEWFDPDDGHIIDRHEQTTEIQPMLSVKSTSTITVPSEGQMLGFRTRAVTSDGSDGQQNIVPLLPAETPVVQSDNFYLAPDDSVYSMSLPKAAKDMKLTLTYCDNPLWFVITALPGIQTPGLRTAPDAAAAVFSTVVARKIMARYPEVAKAVRHWSESADSDSTLTSMLERNPDLKTLLLKSTPWQQEAMSDTERIRRLSMLFDRAQTDQAYNDAIELLEKLRQTDGGMAWNTFYPRSSEWATEAVAAILGELNRIGYFPTGDKRLKAIYHSALGYIQYGAAKALTADPKHTDITFAMLASAAPGFTPSADGQRIIDRTLQSVIERWKSLTVQDKIEAALLLISYNRRAVASEIMKSVDEYSVSNPQLGMWWPSTGSSVYRSGNVLTAARALLAYSMLSPESPQIDPIRQWIIIQNQAMNWGTAPAVSHIVASLLASSPAWVEKAGSVTITVDRKDIAVTPEPYTGSLRASLPAKGTTLTIARSNDTPAWGAVISRYTAVPADIEARPCEGLSIEKRLLRMAPDGSWKEVTELNNGDRVKVVLTVKAGRDIDYLAITDQRAACLEPADQLPEPIWSEGVCFYRENLDTETRIFIDRLRKGTYILTYEMWVNNAGSYASGIATAQSQYAPELTAHSSGSRLNVKRSD